jgi:hypothetical protein
MKAQPITSLTVLTLIVALAGLSVLSVSGAETSIADPTGSWKVTVSTTNTQARPTPQTLKLKIDGGKLSGTLTYNSSGVINGKARVSEGPITEAKLQGNEISFNFTHPPSVGNGPNANYSYQGKISGDTIKGTFTMEWMGNSRTRGWQAERVK